VFVGQTSVTQSSIRILSASTDAGLNHSRALLLREHGFKVDLSNTVEKAEQLIENETYDVLIFGSTLPTDACWSLAAAFRSRHPGGAIIEILPSPWAAPRNRPDATVVGSDEQAKLIATIREAANS